MENCIFCKIIKGEIPSFKVYEDDQVFAFEDIHPVSPGHTLIIPKRHAENIWEIAAGDLSAIHLASQKIARAIKKGVGATGIACLQLNGPDVNQVVLHYHLHLIPRSAKGPELPMTSWDLKQGDMAEIKKAAEKISAALD